MTASTSLRPEASAVLEYLRSHPGATARQIADFAGVSNDYVTRRLNTLYCKGLVGRERTLVPRESGWPWHWFNAEVKK